jgi:hypothetical protein
MGTSPVPSDTPSEPGCVHKRIPMVSAIAHTDTGRTAHLVRKEYSETEPLTTEQDIETRDQL